MKEDKCVCAQMIGIPEDRLIIHLMGCSKDWHTKEYDALPWWKKIIVGNPRSIYKIHKKQTGV